MPRPSAVSAFLRRSGCSGYEVNQSIDDFVSVSCKDRSGSPAQLAGFRAALEKKYHVQADPMFPQWLLVSDK